MKKGIIWCCLMLILFSKASAQISSNASDTASEWYIGFCGEIPMGVSTFSSYGADKTRIGVGAGVYGGYRFNSVFSMEASALWCGMGMSAQKCCIDRGYWLGNDGIRYNVPVAGMQGCSYADVKSKVCLQQYGIHLNVNLLPFFYPVANHRWSISLSPVLYMMASQATLENKVTDENVFRNGKQLNFGFGGDMLVEYKLGKHTHIGLYSGITYVSGKHFDGVPEYRHKNNFICETGVRIGWTICTKRKEQNKPLDSEVAKKDSEVVVDSAVLAEFEQLVTLEKKNVPQDKQSNNNQQICFPTIYFSFNRVDIKSSENDKLMEMKDLLEQHPEIMVNITGWCDTRGSEEVNMRISHQRAETVRRWLIRNGISPSRIRIKRGGTDRTEKKASKARRTQTQERKEKDE